LTRWSGFEEADLCDCFFRFRFAQVVATRQAASPAPVRTRLGIVSPECSELELDATTRPRFDRLAVAQRGFEGPLLHRAHRFAIEHTRR
jgi:hypothetical protein